MGLFSWLLGRSTKTPSREQMAAFVEYANLLEAMGIEQVARGLDVMLLPASREELEDAIARVSLSRWSGVVLKATDLPTAYGLLAYFFPAEELATIDAARTIEERIANGEEVVPEDESILSGRVGLLAVAFDDLNAAKERLQAHAAALRG